MTELTEDERATLLGHIGAWKWERQGLEAAEADFYAAVEAILTARLARVEALADEWERQLGEVAYVTELRAALAVAPSREGES